MFSINQIHQSLLAEREAIRNRGLTFADLLTTTHNDLISSSHSKRHYNNTPSLVQYTPEQKAAYKARKTSQALSHCQKQREKIILRQIISGFFL